MKKILFLLLFTIASYGQAVFDEGIQITNTESTTATKVNVQEANGKVNTKTINTAFNKNFGLNTGDVVGANTLLNQYSTTPLDWTATTFNSGQVVFHGGKQWLAKTATVAGDVPSVSSKWEEITFEALSNKTVTVDQTIIDGSINAVSSNAVFDGLATKSNIGHTHVVSEITGFPTFKTIEGQSVIGAGNIDLDKNSVGLGNVDNTSDLNKPISTATQTALNLKANLASPALTGTPTAPTATAGTNTTQIATTAFVLANAQSIPQLESNATDRTVWNNGKGNVATNTSFGDLALRSNTTGSNSVGFGWTTLRDNTTGASNTAIGAGALALNTTGSKNVAIGSGAGQNIGHTIVNNSVFLGDGCKPLADNQTNQIVIGENATGAGSNTATLGNTSITNTILRGTVTTNGSFIKSSAPTTNILLAGGGDIAQSTFQPSITGLTTNYLPKWNGSGFVDSPIEFYNGVTRIYSTLDNVPLSIISNQPEATIGFKSNSSANGFNVRLGAAGEDFVFRTLNFERLRIKANGRLLINKTDDDLTNQLQVDGTISASSYTATSLPVFENNAAASSLSVGQFYRTSIGVLMVKF